MKTILTLSLLFSFNAFSSVCTELQNGGYTDGADAGIELTKEQWKSLDVLVEYDYELCNQYFSKEVITLNNKNYYVFKSFEDACDGGNTYGAIYTTDLKTAVAHIYDGDVYCKDSWSDDSLAHNHKCDLAAEKYAAKRLKETLGLEFESTSSSLQLRKPYTYSFVFVSGKVKGFEKEVSVQVLTNTKTCEFGGVSINYLAL